MKQRVLVSCCILSIACYGKDKPIQGKRGKVKKEINVTKKKERVSQSDKKTAVAQSVTAEYLPCKKPFCHPCVPSIGKPIVYAPLKEGVKIAITPYGHIMWELFYDTRQVAGSVEDHISFFPEPPQLDIFGRDINAHAQFHMTTVETRVGLKMTGPTWDSIKTSALIEGDFRGISATTVGIYRMRHAYGRIDWKNGFLLFGQYWHPLFIVEDYPRTINVNIGAPLELQARDPQLRVTQRWNWFELIVAALGQRDFANRGPLGVTPDYIRNSLTPNFHLQFRAYIGDHLFGIAGDFKRLVPRLVSNKNVRVDEHINSFAAEAFAALSLPPWSFRFKFLWAQNANDQLFLSGFAVRTVDPRTNFRTYSNTAGIAAWMDTSYLFCSDKMELGLFLGGLKNLGSRHSLFINPRTGVPIIFSLTEVGQNIDYVLRVSPRYVLAQDPIRFGLEIEFTRAAYGTPNRCARIMNPIPVNNVRFLTGIWYIF